MRVINSHSKIDLFIFPARVFLVGSIFVLRSSLFFVVRRRAACYFFCCYYYFVSAVLLV